MKTSFSRFLIGAKIVFSLFSLFCISPNIKAQHVTIKGSVLDSLTRAPIFSANIVLRDINNRRYFKGVVSDEFGNFQFKSIENGGYCITISYLGYRNRSVHVIADENSQLFVNKILLTRDTITIGEIQVNPIIQYEEDSNIFLNLDALGDLEGMSAFEAINSLIGLSDEFDGKIRYNGYTDFTTLIDGNQLGVRYMQMSGSQDVESFILKQIQARLIKSIEVLPEPKGKYGYFTPIINIIPKGNLSDFYKLDSEIGSKNKYGLEFSLSKIVKKLYISPEFSYNHSDDFSKTSEVRNYDLDQEKSYKQDVTTSNSGIGHNSALRAEYRFDKLQNLKFSGEGNFTKNVIDIPRNIIYLNEKNEKTNELRSSYKPNYQYIIDYRKQLNIGERQTLFINLKVAFKKSSNDEEQFDNDFLGTSVIQKFHSRLNKESKSSGMLLNYYNSKHNFKHCFNTGISWNENYEKALRESYDSEENVWNELPTFTSWKTISRISTNMTYQISRTIKIKKGVRSLSHTFQSNISGTMNNDNLSDKLNNNVKRDKAINTSFGFSYRGILTQFGWLVFNYDGHLLRPTANQLFETPIYLDSKTMTIGNSKLVPEIVHKLALDFSWNSSDGYNITTFAFKVPRYGYSIKVLYSSSSNKIVPNHSLNNNGTMVYSYKNCDESKIITANVNFQTKLSPFLNIKLGSYYMFEKFRDSNFYNDSGFSWSFYEKIILSFKKLKVETEHRFNSPRIQYQVKNFSYHEGRIIATYPVWKRNIELSLEATNLLSYSGVKKIYIGNGYQDEIFNYPEFPIIWLRASFLLFKFQKR